MGNRGRRNHRGKEEDDHGGVIASRICSHEPDQVPYSAIETDPVTRSWREHLRRDPVPHGQRVLFNRRWLSEREGELPSGVQAAGWLDIKRVYMELRPELRRLYTTVRDIATYAPIVTPLGFVAMPDAVQLDGVTYHSALLDFGPSSVDGWLAKLAARELLIKEDSILDPVERGALLRDVWGSTYVGSNVVEAVIRSLRKKLGKRAPVIETVRGLGYRLRLEGR